MSRLGADEDLRFDALKERPDRAAMLLAAGEQRRVSTDAMMWQVPALSLTAQSFLLTIVLGGASTAAASRVIAAAVGAVISFGALQQMLKHRYHEEMLSRWLEHLEDCTDLPRLHDVRARGAMITVAQRKGEPKSRWLRYALLRTPAFAIWAMLLTGLATLDVILAVLVIVGVLD